MAYEIGEIKAKGTREVEVEKDFFVSVLIRAQKLSIMIQYVIIYESVINYCPLNIK